MSDWSALDEQIAQLGADLGVDLTALDQASQGPQVYTGSTNLYRPTFDLGITPGSLDPSDWMAAGGLAQRNNLGDGKLTSMTVDADRVVVSEAGEVFLFVGDDPGELTGTDGEDVDPADVVANNPRKFISVGTLGELELSELPTAPTEDGEGGPTPKLVIRSQFRPIDEVVSREIIPRFDSIQERLDWMRDNVTIQDETALAESMMLELYSKDREELMALQRRLFAAGFYGNAELGDIEWGIPDATTQRAWESAVGRAANYFAAGKKVTIDDMIDETIQDRNELGLNDLGAQDPYEDLVISLSDPVSVAQQADILGQRIMGRRLRPEEQRLVIAALHSAERTNQMRAAELRNAEQFAGVPPEIAAQFGIRPGAAGSPGGISTFTELNPSSLIQQQVENLNPKEAEIQSLSGVVDVVRGMLGGA